MQGAQTDNISQRLAARKAKRATLADKKRAEAEKHKEAVTLTHTWLTVFKGFDQELSCYRVTHITVQVDMRMLWPVTKEQSSPTVLARST